MCVGGERPEEGGREWESGRATVLPSVGIYYTPDSWPDEISFLRVTQGVRKRPDPLSALVAACEVKSPRGWPVDWMVPGGGE